MRVASVVEGFDLRRSGRGDSAGGVEPRHVGLAAGAIQVESIVFDRYRWAGSAVELLNHVDGDIEELPGAEVTASPPTLVLAPGGPAQTVEVTIRNDRPSSPWPLRLSLGAWAPVSLQVEGVATPVDGTSRTLLITTPAAGETVTITLRIALPAGATLSEESFLGATVWGAYPDPENAARIYLVPA